MRITRFIDRKYQAASALEDQRQLAQWLQDTPYIVLIKEDLSVAGVISLKDVKEQKNRDLEKWMGSKPKVELRESVRDVIKLFKSTGNDCFGVYHHDMFVGVISLLSITETLIDRLDKVVT